MTWWMRPGPSRFCAIRKPAPSSPSRFGDRHADVRVAHLAVRRPVAAAVAHRRDRAHDVDTRRVGGDDDLRRAQVRVGIRIGDRHHDPERGAFCAGREPLVAVDDVVVAVAHGARAERRRVGSGHFRLGHREEGTDVAGDERREPALLLLVGAEHVQDLGVPGVGRLAAEDELAPERCGRSVRSGTRSRESRCRCRRHRAARAAPRDQLPSPRPAIRRRARQPHRPRGRAPLRSGARGRA